ncbi:hypothetical protein [Gemella morbillorum]
MSRKFILNRAGVAELMKSPEMVAFLKEKAKVIQDRAGDGYETNTFIGKNRANISIKTKSRKAIRDNNKNNTLLKALR